MTKSSPDEVPPPYVPQSLERPAGLQGDWERRCIDRRKSDGKVRKDTVQHGLDVSHGPRVVTFPELLADVEEAVVVGRERGVLGAGLVLQTLPDVALAVRQEHERPTALVRVPPPWPPGTGPAESRKVTAVDR